MGILLRKLTRKSIIGGGKHEGKSVQQLLDSGKTHLLYMYFNYDAITFMDDVLAELDIRPEDIITKPGKAPDKYLYYGKRQMLRASVWKAAWASVPQDKRGFAIHAINKKLQKDNVENKTVNTQKRDDKQNSKGRLAWKNQGH